MERETQMLVAGLQRLEWRSSEVSSATASRSKVLGAAMFSLLTLFAFSLTAPASSYAATLTVCNSGCGYTTIAVAISAASAGDTISITDAGHTESNIAVNKNLTIKGQGATNTAIDGGAAGSVFVVNSGVTAQIQDMTIRNGKTCNYPFVSSGGGVLNYGTLTMSNSTISGNVACDTGGGIATLGGTLTVNNSTISGNSAVDAGGIGNILGGLVTISNSTISGNAGQDHGGGFYQYGSSATIGNSTFLGNISGLYGAGVENSAYGSLTIINSTISGNSAGSLGGGVFNGGTTLMISFTTIAGNSAPGYSGNYGEFWEDPNATDHAYGYSPIFKNSIVGSTDLGVLALNAPGTTETMALLPGSSEIDTATDCLDASGNPVTTDQRGVARPDPEDGSTGSCDIGAFEFSALSCNTISISGSMEGNLPIAANSTVQAGYDFTMPGNHPDAHVTFTNGSVTVQVICPDNSVHPLTISLPTQTIDDPLNSGAWFLSGDQKSSLVYQGSTVSSLCGSQSGYAPKGATFTAQVCSDDAVNKVNVRFHYSDNSAGGWSGTKSITP